MEQEASIADIPESLGDKPGHVVDRDGLRTVADVCEVVEEFLRSEALGFLAASRGGPLLYS